MIHRQLLFGRLSQGGVVFACLAVISAPYLSSLGATRPLFFDKGVFLAGPTVAVAIGTLVAALRRRLIIAFEPLTSAILVTISVLSAIGPALAGDLFGVAKGLFLIFPAVVLPIALSQIRPESQSTYSIMVANCVVGGCIITGSLVAPTLLFVPTRETYSAVQLGWFANPNMYGAAALTVLCSLIALSLDSPWRWLTSRLTCSAAVLAGGVCLWAIFNTKSRGSIGTGILAVLLAAAVVLFRGVRSRPRATIISAVLAGLAIVPLIAWGWDMISDLLYEVFIEKHGAGNITGGRIVLWQTVLAEWWETSPVLGYGPNGSNSLAYQAGLSGPHNAFVRILLDYGLAGALALSVVLFRVLHQAVQRARESSPGMLVVLLVLITHSLFENHLFSMGTTMSSVLFWQFSAERQTCMPTTSNREVGAKVHSRSRRIPKAFTKQDKFQGKQT